MGHWGSRFARTGVVLGMAGVLGTAVALLSSTASSASVAVTCTNGPPPSGSYLKYAEYYNPGACLKCTSAGAFHESTGRYRAYCRNIYNSAGTLHRVDLYLYCYACRSAELTRVERVKA
ncbi:MAG TPA: hypothetical protein VFV66_18110 [Nonomuraea sp.]|nr:hypothetical protein [Nonomuraea sp.]